MILVEHEICVSRSLLRAAKICLIARPMISLLEDEPAARNQLNDTILRLRSHLDLHIATADLAVEEVLVENTCALSILRGRDVEDTLTRVLSLNLLHLTSEEQSTITVLITSFNRVPILVSILGRLISAELKPALENLGTQPILAQSAMMLMSEIDSTVIKALYPRDVLEYRPWINSRTLSLGQLNSRLQTFIDDFCQRSSMHWYSALGTLETVTDVFRVRNEISSILESQQAIFETFHFSLPNSIKSDLHSRLQLLLKQDAVRISDAFSVVSSALKKFETSTDDFNLHKYLWQVSSNQLYRNKNDPPRVQEMCISRSQYFAPSFAPISKHLNQIYTLLDQNSLLLNRAIEINIAWDTAELSRTRETFTNAINSSMSHLDANFTYITAELLVDLQEGWADMSISECIAITCKLIFLRRAVQAVHYIISPLHPETISEDINYFGQQSVTNTEHGITIFGRKLVKDQDFKPVLRSWSESRSKIEPSALIMNFAFSVYQSLLSGTPR